MHTRMLLAGAYVLAPAACTSFGVDKSPAALEDAGDDGGWLRFESNCSPLQGHMGTLDPVRGAGLGGSGACRLCTDGSTYFNALHSTPSMIGPARYDVSVWVRPDTTVTPTIELSAEFVGSDLPVLAGASKPPPGGKVYKATFDVPHGGTVSPLAIRARLLPEEQGSTSCVVFDDLVIAKQ